MPAASRLLFFLAHIFKIEYDAVISIMSNQSQTSTAAEKLALIIAPVVDNSVKTNIAILESHIDVLEAHINVLEAQVRTGFDRLVMLNENLMSIVQNTNRDIKAVSADVTDIKTSITGLKCTNLDSLDEKLNAIADKLNKIDLSKSSGPNRAAPPLRVIVKENGPPVNMFSSEADIDCD